MSRIATYATVEAAQAVADAIVLLRAARARLEKMARDPQKDGADSESLIHAFKQIDRALAALRA